MSTHSEPKIGYRGENLYVGIRAVAPFSGMFAVVDKLLKELRTWVKQHGIADEGLFFLRYHVIDMNGPMDIEVGFVVQTHLTGDERVKSGVLPAGRYASLVYTGSGMQANKALIGWAKDNGIAWDRWDDPRGDAFRARTETYLTDPKVQPLKTKWEVEVAIKIKD